MTLFDNPKTASFALRDYQNAGHEAVRRNYENGINRNLVVNATGLGKTVFFSFLPQLYPDLMRKGMLVLVHRKELVEQAAEKIKQINPYLLVMQEMGDRKAYSGADVVVASVQSLSSDWRLSRFKDRFGIIVVDEAHHCKPKSQYETILSEYGLMQSGGDRLLIGVTATPNRHDKTGLHHFFDDIPVNYDLRWGIQNGYLVDIEAITVKSNADLSNVKTSRGDFVASQVEGKINTDEQNHLVVAKGYIENECSKSLVFCSTIKHAIDLAEVFKAHGIKAQAIHSEMEKIEREYFVEAYRGGDIDVLTNVGVLTEGFDAPFTQEILMRRPTKSTSLFLQILGRGTRPIFPPKSLDVAGRLAEIAASPKPVMKFIDFEDNLGKHNIVSLPDLFGLPKKFKAPPKRGMNDILEEIEKIEEEMPQKNFRVATNLDEIKIISKRIGIWDTPRLPESLKSISKLNWFEAEQGSFKLNIPLKKNGRQDITIDLKLDELGRCKPIVTYLEGVFGGVKRDRVVKEGKLYSDRVEAIRNIEAWVQSSFPEVSALVGRESKWRDEAATDSQIALLKKMEKAGKFQMPDVEMTKGQAAHLINMCFNV